MDLWAESCLKWQTDHTLITKIKASSRSLSEKAISSSFYKITCQDRGFLCPIVAVVLYIEKAIHLRTIPEPLNSEWADPVLFLCPNLVLVTMDFCHDKDIDQDYNVEQYKKEISLISLLQWPDQHVTKSSSPPSINTYLLEEGALVLFWWNVVAQHLTDIFYGSNFANLSPVCFTVCPLW